MSYYRATSVLLLFAIVVATGCTRIDYDPASGRVGYWSVMQHKTLEVERTSGTVVIRYNTDSDPALEAIRTGIEIGRAIAAP